MSKSVRSDFWQASLTANPVYAAAQRVFSAGIYKLVRFIAFFYKITKPVNKYWYVAPRRHIFVCFLIF